MLYERYDATDFNCRRSLLSKRAQHSDETEALCEALLTDTQSFGLGLNASIGNELMLTGLV